MVVNLGRESGTKGYKLYDPVKKKILVSRDVVFDEKESLPWNQSENHSAAHHGNYTLFDKLSTETSVTGGTEYDIEYTTPMQSHYNSGGSTNPRQEASSFRNTISDSVQSTPQTSTTHTGSESQSSYSSQP